MEDSSTTQSSSVGAIRWHGPVEDLDTSSSVPSRQANSSGVNKQSQQHSHQNSLKDLRSLQECVQFINNWKEQVDQVCKLMWFSTQIPKHRWLYLSDDHRRVQEGHTESYLPDRPERFDSWTCVLGWEGYSSGRHYWEVDIANNGYWRVGLTTGDSKRHGRFPMTPRQGYWTLWRSTHQFYACTNQETELPISLVPRRMGIYLDHEEGQISFYNAEETKSPHLHLCRILQREAVPSVRPAGWSHTHDYHPPKKVSFERGDCSYWTLKKC
ncbi:Butyrophilin subfamily 2 member A2 [Nibea albiflora]|uniref:Butyrophilin subfamily 2 member A2 n=1 Tax=Nibea albiflora TaxID=240163 RepID=A0ACB7EW06_NIBAL|nr:Butyrophilin subfamily 2 member A2 [Nibea albiflora]